MKIYHDINEVSKNEKISLAIGNFDGVHFGHLEILKKCIKESGLSLVLTFDVHPREYLYPGFSPRLITEKHEKYTFLKTCGIDGIIELNFAKYCSMEPLKFLDTLNSKLSLESITIGFNFFFGQNQKGNADLMYWWGRSAGVKINVVPPIILNGMRVSSTVIRELISAGEINNAFQLMTYPFVISGTVIEGRKIGRTINFPTLNLNPPRKIMPPDGVYITQTVFKGMQKRSLTNIGSSPTIDSEIRSRKIETWMENCDAGDLYGENISVYFFEKIRDEIRFSSKEKLSEMISVDRSKLSEFSKLNEFKLLPDVFPLFS